MTLRPVGNFFFPTPSANTTLHHHAPFQPFFFKIRFQFFFSPSLLYSSMHPQFQELSINEMSATRGLRNRNIKPSFCI